MVIAHGGDGLSVTAKVLSEKVQGNAIILTGGMIPYKFGSSDGLLREVLSAGVYVAINGRYFHSGNVRKNKQTGQFEEIG